MSIEPSVIEDIMSLLHPAPTSTKDVARVIVSRLTEEEKQHLREILSEDSWELIAELEEALG